MEIKTLKRKCVYVQNGLGRAIIIIKFPSLVVHCCILMSATYVLMYKHLICYAHFGGVHTVYLLKFC